MALNNLGLGFLFTARDHASRTIDGISRSFNRLVSAQTAAAKSMQVGAISMMASMAMLASGKHILDGALFVADASGLFEQKLNILGVSAEATTAELNKMRNAALDTNLAPQFAPLDKVETLKQLAQQGLTAQESLDSLVGTLNFATAAEVTGAKAAATMSAAIKVFGEDAKNTQAIADKLMRTTTRTAIEAHDLEVMLGTVSRGASITKQSLDEMLASMGMVKNTGVDATVAASSVSTALIELVKNSDKLKKTLGVSMVGADNKIRPFLDIVLDTVDALEKIEDPLKRIKLTEDLAGRFGLTSFTAITTQLGNGVKTASGELVKGRAAVDYFRAGLANAGGTTDAFANAVLNSLPGLRLKMANTATALATALGAPFVRLMSPLVERTIGVIDRLIRAFEKLPTAAQDLIARFVLGISAALAIGSALLFIFGAVALLTPAFAMAIAGLKAFVISSWPFLAAGAASILMFVALKRAFDENIGGFGDRVRAIFAKVKLGFEGIMQFMRYGFARGTIAKELAKKENEGVLGFIRVVVGYAFRIKRFFQGIGEGFNSAVDAMGPVLKLWISAFEDLAEHLGIFSKDTADTVGRSDKWKRTGMFIGWLVGKVVHFLLVLSSFGAWVMNIQVKLWLFVGSLIAKAMDNVYAAGEWLKQYYDAIIVWLEGVWGTVSGWLDTAVAYLRVKIRELVAYLATKKSLVDGFVDKATSTVDKFFSFVKDRVSETVDSIIGMWDRVVQAVTGAFDKIVGVYEEVKNKLGDWDILGGDVSAQFGAKMQHQILAPANSGAYSPTIGIDGGAQGSQPAQYATVADLPVSKASKVRDMSPDSKAKNLTASDMQGAVVAALQQHAKTNPQRQQQITVVMDGQKVGEIIQSGSRARAADTFSQGSWGVG